MQSEISSLLTKEALSLLARVGPLDSKADVLSLITSLRKEDLDPQLVTTVINQARLRHRAIAKFGEFANGMLFTEPGLEQATRFPVAALHAQRFRDAGIASVSDLGCGIASDSLAFAALGLKVEAFEKDEETAALAGFNLASFPEATVHNLDALEAKITTEALWMDPARRDLGNKRESHVRLTPEDFSPNLNFVFELANRYPTGVKLSPAFDHDLIPQEAEAVWVSHNSDLVELLLWFGKLGVAGRTSAVMLKPGSRDVFEGNNQIQAPTATLGRYLFEPDTSLIRSHLMGDFAIRQGLGVPAPGIAYLTGDKLIESPWLRAFEVQAVLPLDEKQIRRYMADHNIGALEIKKRGVDITPEELRPKLKLKGKNPATLVLTKVGEVRKAIVCKSLA